MEKFGSFAFLRTTLAAFAVLAMAACAGDGPNPRAANIVPPPPPPNPLQQQAPQQQAGPPAQIAQMPQGQQQQAQQQPAQQQRGAARGAAPAGNLVMGGHLESHKSMEGAEAAWQSLVRKQPALQQLRPYFVPVLVRGEPWVRLLAGDFPDRNEANQFCNWARAQKLYCAPMSLAGASLENPSSIGGGGAPSNSAPRPQPQRQPRSTPQASDGALPVPGPVAPPPPVVAPVAAAPALVAPAPNATPPQPLAPPLPPRRNPGNPALPQ